MNLDDNLRVALKDHAREVIPTMRPFDEVKALHARRLRRKRIAVVLSVVAVIAATASVWLTGQDGPQRLTVAARPDVENATPEQSSTTVTTVADSTVPDTTSTSVAPSASGPPSSPVCRNSYDPACGTFRWDPAPPENKPLAVEVVATPESPAVGETVTFHVTASDPDALIPNNMHVYGFGDPSAPNGAAQTSTSCARQPFGPWTPLAPAGPGRLELDFQHAYSEAGTYTAKFYFVSRDNRVCEDPYGSTAGGTVTVTVR